MVWSMESAGSQNNIRPSAMPSSVSGLSSGMSIGGKKGGISSVYGVAVGLQSPLTHSTGSLHFEQLPATSTSISSSPQFDVPPNFIRQ